MPAEWERHAATWVSWPHNPETWPGSLAQAESEFRQLVCVLANHEPVQLLVQSDAHARHVRAQLPRDPRHPIALHELPSEDSWLRDIGPTFVEDDHGEQLALDWSFNSWGGRYPPWDRDDALASQIAARSGCPHRRIRWIVEGGALEVDGEGTLIATDSSFFAPGRNPVEEREALEADLHGLLGLRKILWLPGALTGDDTDAHIDNLVRFVAPGRVTVSVEPNVQRPHAEALARCRETLSRARDACGRHLEIVDLPLPSRIEAAGEALPASYANFYIVNGALLVPAFGVAEDERAREILGKLFPGRTIRSVGSRTLVRGLGGLHCLTQQQPACGRG
ncbi:MAG: agmatine/peptidylarginine deiminase [Myxococcota bacterium]